jgi:Rad3-related DNA helicase
MEGHPNCPYLIARSKAMRAAVTVHNFDSFFYQNSYGGGYDGRKLLIVDEAHNIPNKFTDFLSFTINSRGGIVVPEATRIADYDAFVQATAKEYEEEYGALQRQYNAVGLDDKSQLQRMQELGKIVHQMRNYLFERQKDNPAEFVFDYKDTGRYAPSVTFRPVFVGTYATRWLFNYGERVILMSATILDKEMFCREVGIDPEEAYYVQVPSTFPSENRPIVKKFAGKMNYTNINDTLPRIAERVQQIADRFPDRKGIVQTHSEKIASYLQANLLDQRFTFNKDFLRPQDMLEAHTRKPGSIIIASGLREGLDLRGDLSQIQVFCKIPYPSLGDKVVKRKMEINPAWYNWITAVNFVQMLGRSVRSPKEKAVTYILDSGFGFFYTKAKRFIPDYIRQAIRW